MRSELLFKSTSNALFYVAGVLALISLSGCYEQPTAETIDYDSGTVKTLRDEVESFDWDQ